MFSHLLTLLILGAIAAGPSFAAPSAQPLLAMPAALDPSQAFQPVSRGARQTREEHKYRLWAHGRPRDEVRGLGMGHRR
jgi:hypothetical protein